MYIDHMSELWIKTRSERDLAVMTDRQTDRQTDRHEVYMIKII